MSTSTTRRQRANSETVATMGVASLSSKRRLEASEVHPDYPTSPKIAKIFNELESQDCLLSTNGHEKYSSEYLTTSILARTLLTTSNSIPCNTPLPSALSTSPLESLKCSLEALPAPMFLESLEELQSSSSFLSSIPKLTTIRSEEDEDLEFNSLLCSERSLSRVTILSPVDGVGMENGQGTTDWTAGILPMKNPSLTLTVNDQLITEDENGKSYFNLGPSEATILAKKSSSSSSSGGGSSGGSPFVNPSKSPPDQTWTQGNSIEYLDDTSSSSSCESISSEDLFNSCEEYDDASEEEEDIRTYKQERSTVLHLSLCKLNSFRTQQCLEPSLHRSVLICNTLRHIEQEIRHEDEIKKNESFLQSHETLPSFWLSNSRHGLQNSTSGGPSSPNSILSSLPISNGHDPYLSSSLYNDAPYSTVSNTAAYDYNSSHRPSQTPFHTVSYDYTETDLSTSSPHPQSPVLMTDLVSTTPSPSLHECDSGYGEDMDMPMSSYYYLHSPPEFSSPVTTQPTNSGESCYLPCTSPETGGYRNGIQPMTTQNSALSVLGSKETLLLPHESMDKIKTLKNNTISNEIRILSVDGIKYNLENCNSSRSNGDAPISTSFETLEPWTKFSSSSTAITSFAQQESQCGMESLRTDFCLGNVNTHSIHHHQLPMDNLISSNYSTT